MLPDPKSQTLVAKVAEGEKKVKEQDAARVAAEAKTAKLVAKVYTQNLKPSTPSTRYPTPYTVNSTPYTLHSTLSTLHPTP